MTTLTFQQQSILEDTVLPNPPVDQSQSYLYEDLHDYVSDYNTGVWDAVTAHSVTVPDLSSKSYGYKAGFELGLHKRLFNDITF